MNSAQTFYVRDVLSKLSVFPSLDGYQYLWDIVDIYLEEYPQTPRLRDYLPLVAKKYGKTVTNVNGSLYYVTRRIHNLYDSEVVGKILGVDLKQGLTLTVKQLVFIIVQKLNSLSEKKDQI